MRNGAVSAAEPVTLTDQATGQQQTVAEVQLYGDVVLRLVSGSFQVCMVFCGYRFRLSQLDLIFKSRHPVRPLPSSCTVRNPGSLVCRAARLLLQHLRVLNAAEVLPLACLVNYP